MDYKCAVLVTNTAHAVVRLGQFYRDRADAENAFDELQNRWGWDGFTKHDARPASLPATSVGAGTDPQLVEPIRRTGASAGAARGDHEPAVADGGCRTRNFARGANDAHAVRVACAGRAGKSGADASISPAAGEGKADCGAVRHPDRLALRVRPSQAIAGRCRLAKPMLEDRLRHRVTAVFRVTLNKSRDGAHPGSGWGARQKHS